MSRSGRDTKARQRAEKKAAKAGARAFGGLPPRKRQVVFYAEGRHDWPHLGPIVEAVRRRGREVTYLTSDASDPVLDQSDPDLTTLPIGTGLTRNLLFRTMEAEQLVMTLPDLESFELKRSKTGVQYLYVFHALMSTHMVYQEGAFDHYDTILTAGPHHDTEIRRREKHLGLPAKELVPHGYGRLDTLLAERGIPSEAPKPFPPGDGLHVLVAASWGPSSLVENPAGTTVIADIIDAGHRVTVRLHPMTVRHHRDLADELEASFGPSGRFAVETDLRSNESLRTSDLMISDWSGASFDYAFAELRPVLYIDMPRKVNNQQWESLDLEPFEIGIRSELGDVVATNELDRVVGRVEALCANGKTDRTRLEELRARSIHHVGNSADIAADWIVARSTGG